MIMETFKIGDKVKVIHPYSNASDFTRGDNEIALNGIYSLDNWEETEFIVSGNFKATTFEHNPKIYGAYPLSIDGKLYGYVYNSAIELVEPVILTPDQIQSELSELLGKYPEAANLDFCALPYNKYSWKVVLEKPDATFWRDTLREVITHLQTKYPNR